MVVFSKGIRILMAVATLSAITVGCKARNPNGARVRDDGEGDPNSPQPEQGPTEGEPTDQNNTEAGGPLTGFEPLVVITKELPPGMDPAFQTRLFGGISAAFQRAAANAATDAAIDANNPNATARTRFDFFRTMASIDSQLEAQVKTGLMAEDLKKLADGQSGRYMLEAMLISSDSPKLNDFKEASKTERDQMVGKEFQQQLFEKLQWSAAAADSSGGASNTADAAINAIDESLVVSKATGDRLGAYTEAFNAFVKHRKDAATQNQTLPIYLAFAISFDKGGVRFEVQTQIKPAPVGVACPAPPPDSPMVPRRMSHATLMGVNSGNPPLGQRVTFRRKYGVDGGQNESPKLVIEYGEIKGASNRLAGYFQNVDVPNNDVRSISYCGRDCKGWIEKVPTVVMSVEFPKLKNLAAGKSTSKNPVVWAAKTIGARELGKLAPIINIYALIKKISVDLSNPTGVRVTPEETEVQVIVSSNTILSKDTNTVQISPNASGIGGWNIYNMPLPVAGGSLGGIIAAQATPQVADPLSQANAQANKAFGDMFGSLLTSFAPAK
jgi:hypothetical protein